MKHALRNLLARAGYALRRRPTPPTERPPLLIDDAFAGVYQAHPFLFVDVGARGGLKPEWSRFAPHLKVLAFEPDEDAYRELSGQPESGIAYSNVMLHDRPGTVSLNITRGGGQSSMFLPDRPFVDRFPHLPIDRWDVMKTVELSSDTLDNVLTAHGMTDVDFIKLDTQGSEKFILEGGERALASSVLGVEVEVEFAPMYVGQPLFADVDPILRRSGFHLFDIRRFYWPRRFSPDTRGLKGQLVWGEALYLKQSELIPPRIEKYLKAVSICIRYGYFDYALEIAEAGAAAGALSREQMSLVRDSLSRAARPFARTIDYHDAALGCDGWY